MGTPETMVMPGSTRSSFLSTRRSTSAVALVTLLSLPSCGADDTGSSELPASVPDAAHDAAVPEASPDAPDVATSEAGDAAVADSPLDDSNDGSPDASGDAALDASDGGPDAGDPIDVAVAALPASCSPLPTDKPACASGSAYDHLAGHCVDGQDALGPFPQYLRDACTARGGGAACATDVWDRDFLLLLQDTAGLVDRTLDEVLAEIKSRPWVYCQPHAQDLEGNGIYQVMGQPVGGRSEDIYPPFVLAPRRQTDSLVRALYLSLPHRRSVLTVRTSVSGCGARRPESPP